MSWSLMPLQALDSGADDALAVNASDPMTATVTNATPPRM
jgi:hypothetical protein